MKHIEVKFNEIDNFRFDGIWIEIEENSYYATSILDYGFIGFYISKELQFSIKLDFENSSKLANLIIRNKKGELHTKKFLFQWVNDDFNEFRFLYHNTHKNDYECVSTFKRDISNV